VTKKDNDMDFSRTRMGQKFFEADVPRIAKSLESIALELKRANDLKEGGKHEDEMLEMINSFRSDK